MTHRPHPIEAPDIAERFGLNPDPSDALLFDDCDDCLVRAREPLTLSESKLAPLWRLMAAVEHPSSLPASYDGRTRYATRAEATAGRSLYLIAVFIERWSPLDPWVWPLDVDLARAARREY